MRELLWTSRRDARRVARVVIGSPTPSAHLIGCTMHVRAVLSSDSSESPRARIAFYFTESFAKQRLASKWLSSGQAHPVIHLVVHNRTEAITNETCLMLCHSYAHTTTAGHVTCRACIDDPAHHVTAGGLAAGCRYISGCVAAASEQAHRMGTSSTNALKKRTFSTLHDALTDSTNEPIVMCAC